MCSGDPENCSNAAVLAIGEPYVVKSRMIIESMGMKGNRKHYRKYENLDRREHSGGAKNSGREELDSMGIGGNLKKTSPYQVLCRISKSAR